MSKWNIAAYQTCESTMWFQNFSETLLNLRNFGDRTIEERQYSAVIGEIVPLTITLLYLGGDGGK